MNEHKEGVSLSEISDKFTEAVLIEILSKTCDGKEVQLTGWNFDKEFEKGDNFMSTIHKGNVHGIVNDCKQHVQVNFFVKSLPKNILKRNTFRCVDFFRNEATFYTKIISKFENFLADKGQKDLLKIPRYLASFVDGENDFIILEDVSFLGFRLPSRKDYLDWTECNLVLKTMAKFHAISFAYRDQKRKEFAEITNCLNETLFGDPHWDWYKKYHEILINITKHTLAIECPNSKAEKQFNSYKFGALFDKCRELARRRDASTSVVTQGDCWVANYLIQEIEQNQKEALILDFQFARCASPVLDLSFLIYSCTLKSFRDQYFDNTLKMYHSELSDAIILLGSDPEKIYPWDLFMKEVKEQFIFGVFASLELALQDSSVLSNLDNIFERNQAVDLNELITLSSSENADVRQRLANMIIDAVEKGHL